MNSVNMNLASLDAPSDAPSDSLALENLQTSQGHRAAQAGLVQRSLAEIAIGEACVVRQLIAPAGMPEWSTQLEDIGFIAGEPVTLMARGAFGGDPLVIRIGLSTFALRKAEAACVLVDVLAAKAIDKAAA